MKKNISVAQNVSVSEQIKEISQGILENTSLNIIKNWKEKPFTIAKDMLALYRSRSKEDQIKLQAYYFLGITSFLDQLGPQIHVQKFEGGPNRCMYHYEDRSNSDSPIIEMLKCKLMELYNNKTITHDDYVAFALYSVVLNTEPYLREGHSIEDGDTLLEGMTQEALSNYVLIREHYAGGLNRDHLHHSGHPKLLFPTTKAKLSLSTMIYQETTGSQSKPGVWLVGVASKYEEIDGGISDPLATFKHDIEHLKDAQCMYEKALRRHFNIKDRLTKTLTAFKAFMETEFKQSSYAQTVRSLDVIALVFVMFHELFRFNFPIKLLAENSEEALKTLQSHLNMEPGKALLISTTNQTINVDECINIFRKFLNDNELSISPVSNISDKCSVS